MKKRIPLFFFIDLYAAAMNDAKRNEVITWFNEIAKCNNRSTSEPFGLGNGNYIGFENTKAATNNWLGARQRYYDYDFEQGTRKVSYKYWKEHIKNHKFTVIARVRDEDNPRYYEGIGINAETVTVVKAKRNEFMVAYMKSSLVTKALRENGKIKKLDSKLPHLIYGRDQAAYMSCGMGLYGETEPYDYKTFEFEGSTLIASFLASGVYKKLWAKCQKSGNYSNPSNIVEAIAEDGSTIKVSRYYHTLPRSNRYNIWFESRIAATNYGYAVCEIENDWLPSAEARKKPNARYHSLERKWNCKRDTETTIGFEIEKADFDAYKIPYEDLYNDTMWIKENDGSLPSDGYELVSPVFDLFSDALDKDIDNNAKLKQLIDGSFCDVCGGHINIASRTYTPIQLLHGLKGFLPLMYAIWNVRMSNRFCQPEKIHNYPGKRGAMHVKSNVLEIRLASAVKSVKNLKWRRDLIRIMIENINKSELEVLRMMLNSRSKLHKHLRKVYNSERFMTKCNLFIKLTSEWHDIRLDDINWEAIDAAKVESNPVIEED